MSITVISQNLDMVHESYPYLAVSFVDQYIITTFNNVFELLTFWHLIGYRVLRFNPKIC